MRWDRHSDDGGLEVQQGEELATSPKDPGDDRWDDPDDNFWDNQPDSDDSGRFDGRFDAFNVNSWNFRAGTGAVVSHQAGAHRDHRGLRRRGSDRGVGWVLVFRDSRQLR